MRRSGGAARFEAASGRSVNPALAGSLILVAVLLLMAGSSGFWLDWQWFRELGRDDLLWKLLAYRWSLVVASAFLALLVLLISQKAALRGAGGPSAMRSLWPGVMVEVDPRIFRSFTWTAIVLALLLGAGMGSRWNEWLLFLNGGSFGNSDPLFRQDIGFFMFRLPFLKTLLGFAFQLVLMAGLLAAVTFWLSGCIDVAGERIDPRVHTHLSLIGAAALLLEAGKLYLDRYDLLLSQGHVLFGAGYADVHARIPALNFLAILCAITAVAFLINARVRRPAVPLASLAILLVASVGAGQLYPSLVQQLNVNPDEQTRERPFIERHIAATRMAYGLDRVEREAHPLGRPLAAADLKSETDTLRNIRLWDYRVIASTFQQIQALRDYYDVWQVDVDRYTIDGRTRQVMLSPRQLIADQVGENQRWINRRLQYTHGYGYVMAAAGQADGSGRPEWITSDLPLKGPAELMPAQPQVYFGSRPQPAVIAPSRTAELDYLAGNQAVASHYQAPSGVPIGGMLKKLLLSFALGDWNILLTDQLQPQSRLLFRRDISRRTALLAPFLLYDSDPYLVIQKDRIYWIQDAYTVSDRFPYSAPTGYSDTAMLRAGSGRLERTRLGSLNYARNSVKVVTDAYSGDVAFYRMDMEDPVCAAYARAFPGLFKNGADMPAALREHIRYPENLFMLQAGKMMRYHVDEPDIFYQQSDLWQIPTERLSESEGGVSQQMEAYYVILRMPGKEKPEFRLILPFRTRAGTTMAAWLSGGCDGDDYGKLKLFEFPTDKQVDAPEQVDQAISADPEVSTQTTLLSQRGSEVLYGHLLVLPVGQSILYVKPFYVQGAASGSGAAIPLLKRVILAEKRHGDLKVVIKPALAEALAALVGTDGRAVEETETFEAVASRGAPPGMTDRSRARLAQQAMERAERALGAGRWAEYGRAMAEVKRLIEELSQGADPPEGAEKSGQ